jgi:amino acid transporter
MTTQLGSPSGGAAASGAAQAAAVDRISLAHGAVGLREVLFQAVTHMGPGLSIAFSVGLGAAFAGGSLSLVVVIALLGCLCVAVSVAELAKYMPSAGGMYTYVARGIHPSLGFLVAWGYALVEPLIAPAVCVFLGTVVAGTLNAEFGWSTDLWWIWSVLAAAIVYVSGFRGVRISARFGTILGAFEIAVFAVFALWLIVKAGGHNDLSVLGPGHTNVPGYQGVSGLFAASIFTILAFTGFESAAPLAEETREPRKNIGRAVIYSCLAVGGLYLLTTYAATVYFGPDKMSQFSAFGGGDPWDQLGRDVWGPLWILIFLAIVNSCLANSNASTTAGPRIWYAMGRVRILPAAFSRVHPRWRSPYVALTAQFIPLMAVALILGVIFHPLTAFGLLATVITAVIVMMYVATNLACIWYFFRERRPEFSWIKHFLIPVLGIAFFIPAWMSAVGITAFKFIAPLSYPATLVGPVVAVWYVIGLSYMVYLYRSRPERIADTAKVFVEDPPDRPIAVAAMNPTPIPSSP